MSTLVAVVVTALLAPHATAAAPSTARPVLAAFAAQSEGQRIRTAVGAGALGAGLVGASITYVAVSYADPQLSVKEAEDHRLASATLALVAVIPAAVAVATLAMPSADEARLARFDGGDAAGALQSLEEEARDPGFAHLLAGSALVAGGLVAGAIGGVYLALPHIPDVERTATTHATGAELIGAGVLSVGVGIYALASSPSTAEWQLSLLPSAGE